LRSILDILPDARVVGGAVRDALAGLALQDIDLSTPRDPWSVSAALRAKGMRVIPTGLDHGTVTAVLDGRGFEITTLRRDVATDGRHAVVAYTDDWREDAARRDFTINAMSLAADGTLFDYFDGRHDLAAGRVRFVGDPARRIAEDYLRILRFFRFYARYGRGTPDAGAIAAIAAGMSGLTRLSPERVWSEFKRILAASDPRHAIALMSATGVLAATLPEGAAPKSLACLVEHGAPADPVLRLAALLVGEPLELAERLRLSGAEKERLAALKGSPVPAPAHDDASLRRLLADVDRPILIGRTWLAQDEQPGWQELRERLATLPQPNFPLEGRDVLALGVPPGPTVGALLREVRGWWLDGGCLADTAACRAELARRVEDTAQRA
jgi:poly(A) polymerase/tRNA nucleotidyltransferase (CCA-adding enzyme)